MVNWFYIVYKKLWKEFGLDKILNKLIKKRKTKFDLDDNSFLIVIKPLLETNSKLSTYRPQKRYIVLPEIKTAKPLSN